jgi:hypothetical protein
MYAKAFPPFSGKKKKGEQEMRLLTGISSTKWSKD